MAEQQLIARFQADVSDLERGVAKAQSAIQSVPAATEKANKQAIASTKNLKKSIGDVGRAVQQVSPYIGGLAGEFVFFAGTAVSSAKAVAAAVTAIVSPVGLAVGGFAAAAVGLSLYKDSARRAAAETKVLEEDLGALKIALDKLGESSKSSRTRIEELKSLREETEKALQATQGRANRKFGEELDTINRQKLLDIDKAIVAEEQKLAQTRAQLADTRLLQIQEDLSKQLQKLERDYQTGGDELEKLRGQVDAYRNAKEKALEVEGLSDDALRDFDASVKSSIGVLEQYEQQLDEIRQQQEDATIPAGAFSPVEQPASAFGAIAGPQLIQATADELGQLDAAFAKVMGSVQTTSEVIATGVATTFEALSQGVAASLVAAVTATGDAAQILASIFNQIATSIIAKIIEVFIIEAAIEKTKIILKSISAYAGLPFVGIALGVAAAGAAIAAARGLAGSEGGRAFAEGGVVLGPTLGLVGEAGPEVVLPLKNSILEKFGLVGGGETTIHNYIHLDGRKVAEGVTKHIPGVVRRKTGTIL